MSRTRGRSSRSERRDKLWNIYQGRAVLSGDRKSRVSRSVEVAQRTYRHPQVSPRDNNSIRLLPPLPFPSQADSKSRMPTPMSPELGDLRGALAKSRDILDWPDDWDGEGSPGYKESTWIRVRDFLLATAESLWRDNGVLVPAPRISAGPEGSFDIHWQSAGKELLINIPEDVTEPVTYYGDDREGNVTKGQLNLATRPKWLLMWLGR